MSNHAESIDYKRRLFVPYTHVTSALFKVLITLKLLHGGRAGAKGSTLEDIAMHMIKNFALDGDIKSQVLASLKYGVKMHFIHKNKDRFSLVLPASSIHFAPCKYVNEEIERIQCIFPPNWLSFCEGTSAECSPDAQSCCGKTRKRKFNRICCPEEEDEYYDEGGGGGGEVCALHGGRASRSKVQGSGAVCPHHPGPRRKRAKSPCADAAFSVCHRRGKQKGGNKHFVNPLDDFCHMCPPPDEDEYCFDNNANINCKCCIPKKK